MARKPPRIEHVKWVGKYAYFNTGQKNAKGNPIRVRLPEYSSAGFWDRYAALKAGRTKRSTPDYTVASLVADYRRIGVPELKSENSRNNYKTQLKKIETEWGEFPADDLQPDDVRTVMDSGKWGNGTCNMVLAVIGAMYKWGRRKKKVEINPVHEIDRKEVGSHDPWPEDILEAALASGDAEIRLAVHLLYFTGQRISDVCRMRWGDIRGGHIHVKQGKTGKTVEPPLTSELKRELERTPKAGLYILNGADRNKLRRTLQAFTESLGVKTVPHGLRKNAVNALLEAGCTVPEVAAITGQTHQVVEHYAAKVNRRKLGEAAILKLDRARRGT